MFQRRLLWLAIVNSTVIYMIILYVMHPALPDVPFDDAVRDRRF